MSTRNAWRQTSPSIKSIMAPPMPQTPRGSSLVPIAQRGYTGQYSRMQSAAHPRVQIGGGSPYY